MTTSTLRFRFAFAHRSHRGNNLVHGHNWGFEIVLLWHGGKEDEPALEVLRDKINSLLKERFHETLVLQETDKDLDSIMTTLRGFAVFTMVPASTCSGLASYVHDMLQLHFAEYEGLTFVKVTVTDGMNKTGSFELGCGHE